MTIATTQHYFAFIDDHMGLQLASVALLTLAMIPICTGSFSSLHTMEKPQTAGRSTAARKKHISKSNPFDDSDDEGEEKAQVLTIKDALFLPVIGSVILYGIYLALNKAPQHYVDQAIQVLTSVLSCAVFSHTAILVLRNRLPTKCIQAIEKYKFSFSKRDQKLCHLNVTVVHLLVTAISIGLVFAYTVNQHWVIGDIFAISLAISCIATLTVDSFVTGFFLLSGMLAYDVFWLFGTDIMLRISNALSYAPSNIVWPRNINTYVFDKLLKSSQYFTSFGLGDIIVPGIFIAYCLRFDRLNSWKHLSHKRGSDFDAVDFPKPYFTAAMIAYGLSAGTSIYLVHFTKKTQSALLFIAPALIVSTIITAIARNEICQVASCDGILKTFNKLSSFSADEEDEEEERPVRFAKKTVAAAASRARSTSTTRGGRSVSRGRGRSKSKGNSRSQSKDPKTTAKKAKEVVANKAEKAVKAVQEATAAAKSPKTTRRGRSTSRAAKKK